MFRVLRSVAHGIYWFVFDVLEAEVRELFELGVRLRDSTTKQALEQNKVF